MIVCTLAHLHTEGKFGIMCSMKIDFHVHSTASDGTDAPRVLARKAIRGGFSAIALTDHDNCDGVAEFRDYRYDASEEASASGGAVAPSTPNPDVARIAGTELSIEPGEGFDRFHLLGLGIDPANARLKEFLKRIIDGRNERNSQMLANFKRIGIVIPPHELDEYAKGEVLARPHIAQWLVAHGYASSMREAFEQYLLEISPAATRCYEQRWHPSQEEAFSVVHEAGGLAIMAHPKYWRTSWRVSGSPDYELVERELRRLKEKGLDGLESVYEANLPREDVAFTIIAERVGLLKSAGSDYHGANKPNIKLGMTIEEFFIAPLMERLGLR